MVKQDYEQALATLEADARAYVEWCQAARHAEAPGASGWWADRAPRIHMAMQDAAYSLAHAGSWLLTLTANAHRANRV